MKAIIENETVEVDVIDYTEIIKDVNSNREWYVFQDQEAAGEAAKKYYQELAENDPHEFVYLVGNDTLISWAFGNPAGPGSTKVKSIDEWFDLWLNIPEEHFGSYDGCEYNGSIDKELMEYLGIDDENVVFYRIN